MSASRDAGSDQGIHEEADVQKAYDRDLLFRLWPFLRPYRGIFALSLVLLPLISALMLVQPYLIKVAIDEYVSRGDAAGLARIGVFFMSALVAEFCLLYVQYYLTMWLAQHALLVAPRLVLSSQC